MAHWAETRSDEEEEDKHQLKFHISGKSKGMKQAYSFE
jgi:hypothetical protein